MFGRYLNLCLLLACCCSFLQNVSTLDSEANEKFRLLQGAVRQLQQQQKLLQEELFKVRGRRQVPGFISFSASLSREVDSIGKHQTIIFDKVIENTGNAYNNVLGIFVAPISGTYVFTWAISTKAGRWQSSELVKEGTAYGYSLADSYDGSSDADYSTATNIVVLKVRKGEHVYIRTGNSGDGIMDGHNYDTFSGWIINQTD